MCKRSGEFVDHLLLNCETTSGIIASLVVLEWLDPCPKESWIYFYSWRSLGGSSQIVAIWKIVFVCLVIWKERNGRIFEDGEKML